jgi:CBS domain-containing protein
MNTQKKFIRDVMSPNVQVLHPGATLKEAAQKMRHLDVGAMPVCEDDRLVGMITDRDIVIRGVANGAMPDDAIVTHTMTMPVHFCFEDAPVDVAARIMSDKQIRRLAVLNRQKRLVGIVSLGDLAIKSRDSEAERKVGEVLERVSEPGNKQAA